MCSPDSIFDETSPEVMATATIKVPASIRSEQLCLVPWSFNTFNHSVSVPFYLTSVTHFLEG